MPRVLFVLPSFEIGGSQRVLLTLLRALDRQRFDPELVVFEAEGGLRHMVPPDVPMHDLKQPRLRNALRALSQTLRARQPDTIFSTLGYVNLAVAAMRPFLRRRARLVIRESNVPSRALPALRNAGALRLGYRLLYPRVDTIICQSRAIEDELVHDFGVARERTAQMRNPVDVATIRDAAQRTERAAGRGQRFIAVGHLIRQKGYDQLLDSFAQLPRHAHLVLCGDGAERGALQQQAQRLGLTDRVRFTGFVGNPWTAVAGADAFLMPSRWEGMPNAALEALACGTPVIATPDAGGLTEVAAAAPAGAVALASPGTAFLAAMKSVQPRIDTRLRDSMLPDEFRLERVSARFQELLS